MGVVTAVALGIWGLAGCAGRVEAAPRRGRAFSRKKVHPKGEDAVFLKRRWQIRWDAEGRRVLKVSSKRRFWTLWGRNHYADPRLRFLKGVQRVRVLRGAVFTPAGKRVPKRRWSMNEVLPRGLAKAPAYTRRRDLVVSFLGVQEGATGELGYEVTDRQPRLPLPWGAVVVGAPFRTKEARIQLSWERGDRMRWAFVGWPDAGRKKGKTLGIFHGQGAQGTTPEGAVVSRGRSGKGLEVEVSDLRGVDVSEEAGGGFTAPRRRLPRWVYSAAKDWEEVRRLLRKRVRGGGWGGIADKKRWRPGGDQGQGPLVETLSRKLTEEASTPLDKVRRLQRFVVKTVRGVAVDWDLHGWAVARPETTAKRMYGHALDKALLLVALLKAQGVSARPVLVAQGGEVDLHVPYPGFFDAAGVMARVEGHELGLSLSEARWLPSVDHLGAYVWDFTKPGAKPRRARPKAAVRRRELRIILKPSAGDGASAPMKMTARLKATIAFRGALNPYLSEDPEKKDVWKTVVASSLGPLAPKDDAAGKEGGGASVRPLRLGLVATVLRGEGPVSVEAPGQGWGALRLPSSVQTPMGWGAHRRVRETGLRLQPLRRDELEVAICGLKSLRKKGKLVSVPTPREVKNSVGAYKRTVERRGDCLVIKSVFSLRRDWISPGSYASLRGLFSAAVRPGVVMWRLSRAPRKRLKNPRTD